MWCYYSNMKHTFLVKHKKTMFNKYFYLSMYNIEAVQNNKLVTITFETIKIINLLSLFTIQVPCVLPPKRNIQWQANSACQDTAFSSNFSLTFLNIRVQCKMCIIWDRGCNQGTKKDFQQRIYPFKRGKKAGDEQRCSRALLLLTLYRHDFTGLHS